MIRLFAVTSLLIGMTLSPVGVQRIPDDAQYLLIDAQSTRSRLTRTVNLSRVRERLIDAGDKGYGFQFMAGFSTSANLLLKRSGGTPVNYRMVTASGEGAFLNDLNQAGSDGFRIVSEGIKAFEEGGTFGNQTTWVAVMLKQAEMPRVKYAVVKGTKEGEEALATAPSAGRRLVAIVGRQGMVAANTLLFFEEGGHAPTVPAASQQQEYRIVATSRTSALQKDLRAAAEKGFRVIGAGFGYMTVVMARERGSTPTPIEYRLIAMIQLETAVKELQAAAAEGFRVAAISENGPEAVFVLHRTPGMPEPIDYQLTRLREATANQTLVAADADGYRIMRLLNDLVLLERQ